MTESLTWLPGYEPYPLADGRLVLRAGLWRGDSFTIKGAGPLGAQLSRLLDGRRTEAEILAQLPPDQREAGQSLVAQLLAAGLIRSTPAPSAATATGLQTYLRATALDGAASEQLARTRLLVVGAGALGSRMAAGAAQLGLAAITLADDQRVTADDRLTNPHFARARVGANRAQYLGRLLQGLHPGLTVDSVVLHPDRPTALKALLAAHDFAIYAADRPVPATWDALNQAALESGTPWAILTTDGLQGFVGPTFFPGESACAACWEQGWTEDMTPVERRTALACRQLVQQPGRPFVGHGGIADLLAGYLLVDLPRLLTRTGGLTAGRALTVDLLTLACDLHEVYRRPRCPACRLRREQP